jgi:hypothetical protein
MAKKTGICGEPHADLCPEAGHNAGHRCERPTQHDDGRRDPHHQCACERRWMGGVPLPKIERATVVEIRPGDVLVFEIAQRLSDAELEAFCEGAREAVSEDVRVIVVEHGHFAGVIRHAGSASLPPLAGKEM